MTEAADESGRREAGAGPGLTLGVGTLMVVVALIGVTLAVGRESPGLGIATASVLAMALQRTYLRRARRSAAGRPMTQGETVTDLLASIGIVLWIGLVFLIVCSSISFAGWWIASVVGEGSRVGDVESDLVIWGGFAFVGFAAAMLAAAFVASRLWRDLEKETLSTDADRRASPDE